MRAYSWLYLVGLALGLPLGYVVGRRRPWRRFGEWVWRQTGRYPSGAPWRVLAWLLPAVAITMPHIIVRTARIWWHRDDEPRWRPPWEPRRMTITFGTPSGSSDDEDAT